MGSFAGWKRGLVVVVVLSAGALGCSSDDASSAGAIDPKDCDAVTKRLNALNLEAGCDGSEANGCTQIYASNQCVSEWEATINCMSTKTGSDFTCKDGTSLEPKPASVRRNSAPSIVVSATNSQGEDRSKPRVRQTLIVLTSREGFVPERRGRRPRP